MFSHDQFGHRHYCKDISYKQVPESLYQRLSQKEPIMARASTRRFVRIKEATAIYSVSRSSWYRAIEANALTRYKRGGIVWLDVDQIESWITSNSG